MADSFRMNTSGDKAYREDLLKETAERFGEATKVGGIVACMDWTAQMERALQEASEHEDMTEDLADVLSTDEMEIVHEVERDFRTVGEG